MPSGRSRPARVPDRVRSARPVRHRGGRVAAGTGSRAAGDTGRGRGAPVPDGGGHGSGAAGCGLTRASSRPRRRRRTTSACSRWRSRCSPGGGIARRDGGERRGPGTGRAARGAGGAVRAGGGAGGARVERRAWREGHPRRAGYHRGRSGLLPRTGKLAAKAVVAGRRRSLRRPGNSRRDTGWAR